MVIDTPPAGRAVVMSAMPAAAQHGGQILIPLQPATHDLDQLGETLAVVEDATGTAEVAVSILLTRAVNLDFASSLGGVDGWVWKWL